MGRDAINPLHRVISKDDTKLDADSDSSDSTSDTSESVENGIIPNITDGEDEFNVKVGDVLISGRNEFVVLSFLGAGTFGKVIKCRKARTNDVFAIKVLGVDSLLTREGDKEIQILKELGRDAAEHHIVKFYETFAYQSHKCLVFEVMEMSLRDFTHKIHNRNLELNQIRNITSQLLKALVKLSKHGIVHTDLKPANIMMVNTKNFPYRIKVIDFGGAFHLSQRTKCDPNVGTRWYRAPEVILGLPISRSLDIWSLGCIGAQLLMGTPLYPGASNYEVMQFITESQGLLPDHILQAAPRTDKFFVQSKVNDTSVPSWRLKVHGELEEEPELEGAKQYTQKTFWRPFEKFNLTEAEPSTALEARVKEQKDFVALLRSMLALEQAQRISAENALHHPFIKFVSVTGSEDSQLAITNPQRPARARMGLIGVRTRKPNPVPQNIEHNGHQLNNPIPSQSISEVAPETIEGSRKRKIDVSDAVSPPEKKQKIKQTARKTSTAYNTHNTKTKQTARKTSTAYNKN